MRFYIDEVEVFFPYPFVYNEQLSYMTEIKKSLDTEGKVILEMPTGTGKTISLLSMITSYLFKYPEKYLKLIYCTRTVVEMEKTLKELKFLIDAREKEYGVKLMTLAVGLSARRNLCIHPEVSKSKEREKVDAECRKLTAEWVRSRNVADKSKLCSYYENFLGETDKLTYDRGIFTLEDIKVLGLKTGMCPYFLCKKIMASANIIVYNYMYLLDPKISEMVRKEMKAESVVVFDEAHNIDDVCIEAYTVEITRSILERASKNVDNLRQKVESLKKEDISKLDNEYKKLLEGLSTKSDDKGKVLANIESTSCMLPKDLINEAIPGNIRKAEHFVLFLKRVVAYLKLFIKIDKENGVKKQTPIKFLEELRERTFIDKNSLRFSGERLTMLLNTLEVSETDDFQGIIVVSEFSTLVASPNSQQFELILEPNPTDGSVSNPLLTLACLDSSIAIKPVFEKFRSVILTSGTMSPMEMYPKLLDFQPTFTKSIDIKLSRNNISPLIITKGPDQNPISSEFSERNNASVKRNYGNLLLELCSIVPDGVVCFFPSYGYMEEIILKWNEMNILEQILEHKLLYIESKDVAQTSLSLTHFRKACDCGRGAIFLAIARGKIAEGIDFDNQYGRCVVMIGVPFQYTKSRTLLARLEYLKNYKQIKDSDFLKFDAMRQSAQCLGRVIRRKNDYGLMILADKRYEKSDKKDKLPNWIKKNIEVTNTNLSTDTALFVARDFFRRMAQPFTITRSSYNTQEDFNKIQSTMVIEKPQPNAAEAKRQEDKKMEIETS